MHQLIRNSGNIDYILGKQKVANHIYLGQKHQELSLSKCYLALMIRTFISLTLGIREQRISYLQRAWGNVVRFGKCH